MIGIGKLHSRLKRLSRKVFLIILRQLGEVKKRTNHFIPIHFSICEIFWIDKGQADKNDFSGFAEYLWIIYAVSAIINTGIKRFIICTAVKFSEETLPSYFYEERYPMHRSSRTTAPTIKDVAREAGVSIGTVSKVINNKPVGDIYVRKVNEAIEKLDYQVNSNAQGLKSRKTNAVAVILPNTINPFFGKLAYDLNNVLSEHGYNMYLCCTDYNEEQEQEYLEMARQKKIDGIIGLTYSSRLKVSDNIPFVSIDRPITEGSPCVTSDNYTGGQLAARKLAELGCRNVLFLGIESKLSRETKKRRIGFKNECETLGLGYGECVFTDEEDLSAFKPYLEQHIQNGHADFEGIFCVTDATAFSVIGILHRLGLRVPEDIQVIGYDGLRQPDDRQYMCSTIEQPVRTMAEMCVEILFSGNQTLRSSLFCLPVKYIAGPTTKDRPEQYK